MNCVIVYMIPEFSGIISSYLYEENFTNNKNP